MILVYLCAATALLTLIVYIYAVQSPAAFRDRPNAPMPVKLPTDGLWVTSVSDWDLVFFMLDDRVRFHFRRSDDPFGRKWTSDMSTSLEGVQVGAERWLVLDPFGGHVRPGSLGIGFPLWVPLLLFLVYPAVVFIGLRRRRRRRARGLCLSCGYDLTGNTSGLCPECGMPILGSERCCN